ncbi:post-segregation antitoxin (ccd killing protein) [Rhizobium sp. SG_E_25_P2]|uniref:DUF6364 family protein n=1 Tax=Rhizobium sp. SG_E_25_P2 TaxID=2879942 RepID=UPI002473A73F|nr:DUF6364 family protein [Rhizobium sp. SG_E_25_P2]MDH6267145.1 post-segregation antitoxin (ccd killing protein) [Rhizobium sp. SG_E_25_P2]
MTAITLSLPQDTVSKAQDIARDRNMDLSALVSELMQEMVRSHEAELRFRAYAERGRGREEEALALLGRD